MTYLLYWIFQCINTVCPFIYLDLLWFLPSAFGNFQHTGLTNLLLDLHLSVLCHLQIQKFLFLHFQSIWQFIFLALLQWLELPVLCCIRVIRMDILALLLMLGKRFSLLPLTTMLAVGFLIGALYLFHSWGSSLYLTCWEFLL